MSSCFMCAAKTKMLINCAVTDLPFCLCICQTPVSLDEAHYVMVLYNSRRTDYTCSLFSKWM